MAPKYKLAWWSVAAVLVVLLGGGVWLNKDAGEDRVTTSKLVVGASVFPVADMVKQVGGDLIEVVLVVPPGFSPHAYSLLPSQVAELQSAAVIFSIGQGFDDGVVRPVSDSAGIEIVTLDNGIELRKLGDGFDNYEEGDEAGFGEIDPHYWLDVKNARVMVRVIAEELARIDAGQADKYMENAARYEQRLDELEDELQQQATKLDQPAILTLHDGWGYFARAYGLRVVDTYEPVEGKQPTVEDLRRIKTTIDEYGVKKFYTEPQKSSTAATRFMREEFGLEIGILDPVGGGEGAKSYEELMKKNIEAISK